MRLTESRLRALVQGARRRQPGSACPSGERLAELAAGDDVPDREALADHLASCTDCAEEYRAVGAPAEWMWSALGSRDPASLPGSRRERPRFLASPRPYLAAAAGLLVATASLGLWTQRLREDNGRLRAELDTVAAKVRAAETGRSAEAETLRHRVDALEAPHLNVPVRELLPRGLWRGAVPTPPAIAVPAGAEWIGLLLHLEHDPRGDAFAVELRDSQGRTTWSGEGLRPEETGSFSLVLPSRLLPPGRHQVRLLARRGGVWAPLEEYPIVVTRAEAR